MTLENCSQKYSLPTLGFDFKSFSINGRETSFELIFTPDNYVLEFEVNGKNDCVIGIGSDNEDSGWTLGQVFLKAYYSVFDRDTKSIGFVRSNPDPFNMINENSKEKDLLQLQNTVKSNNFMKKARRNEMIKQLVNNRDDKLPKEYNGSFSFNNYNPTNEELDNKLSSLFKE